jgi:hypothetical protein
VPTGCGWSNVPTTEFARICSNRLANLAVDKDARKFNDSSVMIETFVVEMRCRIRTYVTILTRVWARNGWI